MQYVKFNNEKYPTDFTLMVPISSYDIISTDTTCGLVNSIRDFFKNVEESLKKLINGNYNEKIKYKAEIYLNHIKCIDATKYKTDHMPKSNARVLHLEQIGLEGGKTLPAKMVAFRGSLVEIKESDISNNLSSQAISRDDFSKEILEDIGTEPDDQVQEKLQKLECNSNDDFAKHAISIIDESLSEEELSNLLQLLRLNEESKKTIILHIENIIRLRNVLNAVFCLCTEKFKQNKNFMRQDLASYKNNYREQIKNDDKTKYLYEVKTVTATRHRSNYIGGINEAEEIKTEVVKFNYEFMNEMINLMRKHGICFNDKTPEEYNSIIEAVIPSLNLDLTKLQDIKDPIIAILKSGRRDKKNCINNCIQFVFGLIKIRLEDEFGLEVRDLNSSDLREFIKSNFNSPKYEDSTFDSVYEYLINLINNELLPEKLFEDKFKEELKEKIYQRWNRIVDDQLHFDEFLVLSDIKKGEYEEFQHKLSCSYEFYAEHQLKKPVINIFRENATSNIALFTSFALISMPMIIFNSQLISAFSQGLLGHLLLISNMPIIQIFTFSLSISIIIKLAIENISKYENTTYDTLKNSIKMFLFTFLTLTIISLSFPITTPYLAIGYVLMAENIKNMLLCLGNTSIITIGVVRLAMSIFEYFKYPPPSPNIPPIEPLPADLGFQINHAPDLGVQINHAADLGFQINHAADLGVQINHAADLGFQFQHHSHEPFGNHHLNFQPY